ncbi:MAG: mechanosensitive ion channel [Bacteroidetes bacterium]|nr:MAG: mechanosensitive ion channel [Bacteroidota bacterium]
MEQKTYIDQFYDLILQYGPRILSALTILIVGLWLIRRISESFERLLQKRNVDPSLQPFLTTMTDVALKVALLLVVAAQAGIETTSFIAVFSAVAFAVGLALQGSLSNFASGVLILLFRPYRVGDLISVENHLGFVTEIQIFNTILTTEHGKKIVIPNSKMTDDAIENAPKETEVQVEVSVLVDSATPVPVLREAAEAAAARCPWALPGRRAEVVLSGVNRDDMKVDVAIWTVGENYIHTLDYIYEALLEEFTARKIQLAPERRREILA